MLMEKALYQRKYIIIIIVKIIIIVQYPRFWNADGYPDGWLIPCQEGIFQGKVSIRGMKGKFG